MILFSSGAEYLRQWFALNPRGPVVGGFFNKPVLQPTDSALRPFFLKEVGMAIQNKTNLKGVVYASVVKVGLHTRTLQNSRTETVGTISICDGTGTISGFQTLGSNNFPSHLSQTGLELGPKDADQLM